MLISSFSTSWITARSFPSASLLLNVIHVSNDLGGDIRLRKIRGQDLDTGEAATVRLLDAGRGVIGYPLEFCVRFDVGHPHFPTVAAGVFHAWYGTRLGKDVHTVEVETNGAVTNANYLKPLQTRLRQAYHLDY